MQFKDKPYHFIPATIPEAAQTIIRDVDYGPDSHQHLDIYLPTNQQASPVILDLYGGGLLRGQKSSFKLNPSLRFLADGFAVVSMAYRLNTPRHNQFPAQLADISAALHFLAQQASAYHLDMTHITQIGESSGAQLAVLAAASFSAGVPLGPLSPTDLATLPPIQRVIGLYGPYQVDQMGPQFQQLGITPQFPETGTADAFEGIMLDHHAPATVPKRVQQANPATYLTPQMPPLFLIAGTKDPVVPYLQSVTLAQQYQIATQRPAKTLWVPGGVHGPADYDTDAIYQEKYLFITQAPKNDA